MRINVNERNNTKCNEMEIDGNDGNNSYIPKNILKYVKCPKNYNATNFIENPEVANKRYKR